MFRPFWGPDSLTMNSPFSGGFPSRKGSLVGGQMAEIKMAFGLPASRDLVFLHSIPGSAEVRPKANVVKWSFGMIQKKTRRSPEVQAPFSSWWLIWNILVKTGIFPK